MRQGDSSGDIRTLPSLQLDAIAEWTMVAQILLTSTSKEGRGSGDPAIASLAISIVLSRLMHPVAQCKSRADLG
jgi:hypothetical protein